MKQLAPLLLLALLASWRGGGRCGGSSGIGLGNVGGVGLWGRVLQLETEVVDEKPDVHVGERNLEMLGQFLLHDGQAVAGGDPRGDGLFLFGRERHGIFRSGIFEFRFGGKGSFTQ